MKYYYIDVVGNQSTTPVDESELVNLGVTEKTPVWCEGMPGWAPAGSIPALKHYFAKPAKPDNYLWLGIVTTILCCLPFGIVSIVYASKVDSLWLAGHYEEALDSSSKAKTWGYVSGGVGLAVALIYFIIAMSSAARW